MSMLNFDTLKFRKGLEANGMSTELAGAVTRGLAEAITQGFVAIPKESPCQGNQDKPLTKLDWVTELIRFERRMLVSIALVMAMEILLVVAIAKLLISA